VSDIRDRSVEPCSHRVASIETYYDKYTTMLYYVSCGCGQRWKEDVTRKRAISNFELDLPVE
jgi:hypothetical protein